jgi:hypothetical protein
MYDHVQHDLFLLPVHSIYPAGADLHFSMVLSDANPCHMRRVGVAHHLPV